MLHLVTDGFYFKKDQTRVVQLAPAPGCPLEPVVCALEPGDASVLVLEPMTPSVQDPTEVCPPSVQGIEICPPSVSLFKPLSPITINEDDC